MKPEQFQSLIRRILNEEVEKQSVTDKKIYQRVPEVVHGKDYEKVMPHTRDGMSKDELLDDMDKVVKGINKDYTVVWDDHDDISINARDLFRIRVIPKWESNYCIEAFTRNEDRIYITGQSWDQVKEFVKINLKDPETNTQKAYDKSIDNELNDKTEKADKDLPQKDKPKTLPTTNEAPKTSKNKEKDYTEEPKDNDDLPEKPMKEVGEFERQSDHKVKDPVKVRKRKPDTKLFIKQS